MDEEIEELLAEEYDNAETAVMIEKAYFDDDDNNEYYLALRYKKYIYTLYTNHMIKINEYYPIGSLKKQLIELKHGSIYGYKKCPEYTIPVRFQYNFYYYFGQLMDIE